MSDPIVFWTAFSAIMSAFQATILFVSALTILHQLRQFRQESIESRIAGLNTALDVLNADEYFAKASNAAIQNGKVSGGATWNNVFEVIDRVALLIDQKYTEEGLLFKLKGHELAAIGKYLAQNQIPEESRQLFNSAKYKAVRDLLDRSITFTDKMQAASN